MSELAIRTVGLGKRYRIGEIEHLADFRDLLKRALRAPARRLRGRSEATTGPSARDLWAIRDVSLEIKEGEVLGLIGRNGAGKTTLLRILSRITSPTEGYAEIGGRVGSLLEVGTGFHQDLTGRENVFLNGAILGMGRIEIKRKMEEIVEFAGVERFIDTPVKRYSTGMQTRLAFSVAAHLEPEVLLVDEVLAVGDYEFQRKCLGKMEEVGRQGRTVLLVSHNLASIMNLCPRTVVMDGGKVAMDGPSAEVIQSYVNAMGHPSAGRRWANPSDAPGNARVRLHAVEVASAGRVSGGDLDIAQDITIRIAYWNLEAGSKLTTAFHLSDQMGTKVLASSAMPSASLVPDPLWNQPHPEGLFESVCTIPANLLNEGTYSITAIVGSNVDHVEARLDDVVSFSVFESGAMRKERSGLVEIGGKWLGLVRPRLAWRTERVGEVDAERVAATSADTGGTGA